MSTISAAPYTVASAEGINDFGAIAGTFASPGGATTGTGFVSASGTVTLIGSTASLTPCAINNAGDLTGVYTTSDGHQHGFICAGGTITTFDPVGSTQTIPVAINAIGQVVGTYDYPGGSGGASVTGCFVYTAGSITTIAIPGATSVAGNDINAAGNVVGTYVDASGNQGAFLDIGGAITTIDPAPSAAPASVQNSVVLSAINDLGEAVGAYVTTTAISFPGFHSFFEQITCQPFIYLGGSITLVTVPGVAAPYPTAINDAGVFAGEDQQNALGFVDSHGSVTTLPVTSVNAINGAGAIVGSLSPGGPGFVAAPACFAAGTRILTDRGERPVEALEVGDHVVTHVGRCRPIAWIGHRRIDCRRHPTPETIWPIRVQAGSFGPSLPHRDLFLSPDHAVFADGVLIPIRHLVNGASIAQLPTDTIAYWHLELPVHDVVLAEGLPAESYLDTGNRAAFANGGDAILAHPDFALSVWQRRGCAALAVAGPHVARVRRSLLAQAVRLGHARTAAPDLHLLADRHPLRDDIVGTRHHVRMPPGTSQVHIVSRIWTPAHMFPDHHDQRRLGAALADIRRDGEPIPLDDSCFVRGWHDPEPGWRWTDGNAAIAARGARDLSFDMPVTGAYWSNQAAFRQVRTRS